MNQTDLITRLAAGEAFGGKPPERIDTHISVIFLTDDRAYKLKRAIRTSYLDYTSIEARKYGSEREVALNSRTAPELYIRAVAVTLSPQGRLAIGGDRTPIDWLVEMKRFNPRETLDILAAGNRLEDTLLRPLADQCAEMHRSARVIDGTRLPATIAGIISGNRTELAAAGKAVFGINEIDGLISRQEHAFLELKSAMEHRAARHHIRECHGDLHLGNICLVDGRPTIFDAIEFNESFNEIDTFYDLAFLLMDLMAQNDRRTASLLFNRYLFRISDYDELRVLPFYQSLRATIRAHVLAKSASQTNDGTKRETLVERARHYFDTASDLLKEAPVRIIAIGGYSGTGKSTLANRIAPWLGASPGAVVLSSDLTRKRLFSAEPENRLDPQFYRPEASDRVYRELLDCAGRTVGGGATVILDATFTHAESRDEIEKLAATHGVDFHGYWLVGDAENLARRVAERPQGASDATVDVLRQQLEQGSGEIDWRQIDTTDASIDAGDLVRRDLGLIDISADDAT